MKRHVVCCSRPLVVMFPAVVSHAPDGGFSGFRHWVFVWPALGGGGKVCYSKILGYGKNQESLVYYYYFDL